MWNSVSRRNVPNAPAMTVMAPTAACARLWRRKAVRYMIAPILFHVAYTVYTQEMKHLKGTRWRFFMNRSILIFFYCWSFAVYVIGWTEKGVASLRVINPGHAFPFYFPVPGEYSWVFYLNTIMFAVSLAVSYRCPP